ncbi:MAG: LuxR C-terminal-related transcriptional regulator [Myxococcota bacterium]|nr:LuxR C-terminal-related transcriptional regulator [Myxococcota bacterium]
MNLHPRSSDGHHAAGDVFDVIAREWDGAPIAACAYDPEGRFRYANAAFGELVGWKPQPFFGRRPPRPWWEESETDRTRRQLEAWVGGELRDLGVAGVHVLARHRTGRPLELVWSGASLRDEQDKPVAFVGVAVEVGGAEDPDGQAELRAAAEHLLQTAELVQRSLLAGGADPGDVRIARVPGAGSLSGREREVLRRLGDGLRVSTIAAELGIRPATVRNHLKSIYRKTGLRSQARLVSALRLGR